MEVAAKQSGRFHAQKTNNNNRRGELNRNRSGSMDSVAESSSVKDISPEGNHVLENNWKFWYFANQKNLSWEKNLQEVAKIGTVEDFWSVYDAIKLPSEIELGCSYFFFKEHLKPMWEDEGNRHGGRWLCTFNKQKKADEKWFEVLLCLIGEAFDEDGEDICGAVVDVRSRLDKISIWTKDCKNEARIMKIGSIIKERLHLTDPMNYERHVDTANKSGGRTNHLFTL